MAKDLFTIRDVSPAPVPKFCISKGAAEALLGEKVLVAEDEEWNSAGYRAIGFSDVFSIEDTNESYQTLVQLVRGSDAVAMAKINGLSVIAIPEPTKTTPREKKEAARRIAQEHGIPMEYARKLYNAFGNAAFEIAGDVAKNMVMPLSDAKPRKTGYLTETVTFTGDNGPQSKMHYGAASVRKVLDEFGVSANLGEVCRQLAASGYCADDLRNILKRKSEIDYIAAEYRTSIGVARVVHGMLEEGTGGMLDIEVLKRMDLSMQVEALRHTMDANESLLSGRGYARNGRELDTTHFIGSIEGTKLDALLGFGDDAEGHDEELVPLCESAFERVFVYGGGKRDARG